VAQGVYCMHVCGPGGVLHAFVLHVLCVLLLITNKKIHVFECVCACVCAGCLWVALGVALSL